MAQSIRISDDLYSMAQNVSLALGRPLAQQMEYWARLGAALDAAGISADGAMELLNSGIKADEFVAVALGQVPTEKDGGLTMLKERQRKAEQEVVTGQRSARSLWVVGEGDLKGACFTLNPESEFAVNGVTWR
ncbi:TA system antitoxin ParD family protein [Rhodoferax saidenbachensis]|uniref:ParD-like antitoxin of type II toxin-antitoxin system n=1 Tax=Rhodoferax saidenbachensis TaxID=1484693 RepID=A0ABU1ZS73_9BURK|nr:hypothetical protein [Rhodoferax saidenbachensis]MDR7308404.1 hypothetical protein [Rhodoferax saidenbachensis]